MKSRNILSVLFILLAVPMLFSPGLARTLAIAEDTEIKIRFDSSMIISSKNLQPGIPILIRLDSAITVAGDVVVEAGAEGKAEVVEVVKPSKPGKPGYIKVEFSELSAKGIFKTGTGEPIKLKGTLEDKGGSKKIISYIFIFGLFIKGGNGVIDTDSVYTAKIKETIIMQSE